MAVSSGEVSGDAYGASLVSELARLLPDFTFAGVGGELLARVGVKLWANNCDIGVVGLAEVGGARNRLLQLYRFWGKQLYISKPSALLCIDYGGFHMLLMRLAHNMGIPTIHYIPSKIWTWGTFRATFYRHWVDLVLSIFPFEAEFLRQHGIFAQYVGNPVMDRLWDFLTLVKSPLEKMSLGDPPLICLFPGSRQPEITNILPLMVGAAELIKKQIPQARFALALAPTVSSILVKDFLDRVSVPIEIYSGDYRQLMLDSDVGLIKSGTSVLEAALLGLPHMLIYKTSAFTWEIGSRLAKVKWMGLPNLIMHRTMISELLQYDATPEKIASEALNLLQDEGKRRQMLTDMVELRQKVGTDGASKQAARSIVRLLAERGII